jgi:hypothetical protein
VSVTTSRPVRWLSAAWLLRGVPTSIDVAATISAPSGLPGAIAVFVEVIATASFVSWLLLTIVPQQVAAQVSAARVVVQRSDRRPSVGYVDAVCEADLVGPGGLCTTGRQPILEDSW